MEETEEESLQEGFPCPKCGEIVEVFETKPTADYAVCTICRQPVSKKEIPEEYLKTVEKLSLKKAEKTVKPQVTPSKGEEEEGEEESPPMYERPLTATEVLREVLKKYKVRDEAIEFFVNKSELRGGWHPTDLGNKLEELSRKFTGIEDPRLIPDIVEDYWLRLEEEEKKAAERGFKISYPLRRREQPYGYKYIVNKPREGWWGWEGEEWFEPKRYIEHAYPSMPPIQKTVTAEDLARLEQRLIETFSEKKEKEKTEERFSKIEERINEMEKEFIAFKKEVPQQISAAITEFKEAILDELKEVKEKVSTSLQPNPSTTVTKEDLEKTVEKHTSELRRDFEHQLAIKEKDEIIKKMGKTIKGLHQELRDLKEKVKTPVVGRTKEDLVSEGIAILKEKMAEKPIVTTAKIIFGRPEEEKPPKRVEEEKASEGVLEFIDEEFIEEEEEA